MNLNELLDGITKLQTGLTVVKEMRKVERNAPGVEQGLDAIQAKLETDFNNLHKAWIEATQSGKNLKRTPHGTILKSEG